MLLVLPERHEFLAVQLVPAEFLAWRVMQAEFRVLPSSVTRFCFQGVLPCWPIDSLCGLKTRPSRHVQKMLC